MLESASLVHCVPSRQSKRLGGNLKLQRQPKLTCTGSHGMTVSAKKAMLALMCAAACMAPVPSRADDPKIVLIGAENDAAPWSYADGSGFVNNLVTEALSASGWKVDLQVVPYARCKRLAQTGKIAACFSVSRTGDPDPTLLFPKMPVIDPHFIAYADVDSPMTNCNPASWRGQPHVALVNGYEYVEAIERLKDTGAIRVETVNSEVAALNMLAARRIDAVILTLDDIKHDDMLFAQALPRTNHLRTTFHRACDFGSMPAYIAFSAKHPVGRLALSAFEDGMAMLERRGRIRALQQEWAERALLLERARAARH